MTSPVILRLGSIGLFAFFGLLLGVAQFASLDKSVRLYVGGRSLGTAAGLHVARLLLVVAAWVVVARFGRAGGLCAAFVGFLVSRPIVTARLGRARR